MRARGDVVVFAGPTLATSARARTLASGLDVRPPVKRADVAKLVASRARPGVLVIVDGVFHEALAVGHAEIRDAVRAKWNVWGVSSMGAIRAREMTSLGVNGFGKVFERYCGSDDFQDDEVALLHASTAPYAPLTEPLVHLREAIAFLVRARLVSRARASDALRDLKSRWYGERTIRGACDLLARGASSADGVRRELADFDRFRVKSIDLERFLEEKPFDSVARNPEPLTPRRRR